MKVDTLKELREKYQLSQQNLADATGIPRGRIAKWEQSKGKPKADDVRTLADFFASKSGEEITNDSSVNDSGDGAVYTSNKKADKIIEDLAASSRDHAAADLKRAEAEILREQNHKRIIDHITANGGEGIPIGVGTISGELRELLIDLGLGKNWSSREEGAAAVRNALYGKLPKKKVRGIRSS